MSEYDAQELMNELYAEIGDPQAEAQALAPPLLPAGEYIIQVIDVKPVINPDDATWAPGHAFLFLKATANGLGAAGGNARFLSFRVTPRKLMSQGPRGEFPSGPYRLFAQMRDAFGIDKTAPAGAVIEAAMCYPLYAKVSSKVGKDGVERNNVDRLGKVK